MLGIFTRTDHVRAIRSESVYIEAETDALGDPYSPIHLLPKCVVRIRAMLDAFEFEIVCYQNKSAILYVVNKPRLPNPFRGEELFFLFFV